MMTRKDSLYLKLFSSLKDSGFKARVVSVEHLYELKDEIERSHYQRLFDEDYYRELLVWFDFTVPNALSEARSIIVVAAPQPALQVTFMRNGCSYDAIVPPTYCHDTDQQAYDGITEVFKPEGYQLVRGELPDKLLATRSGLAKYGKNNITYVDHMGSYHRLTAFYTDAPVVGEQWGEPQMLDLCHKCVACTKKCPQVPFHLTVFYYMLKNA